MMIVFFVLGFKIILLFMFVYRIVSRILKKSRNLLDVLWKVYRFILNFVILLILNVRLLFGFVDILMFG